MNHPNNYEGYIRALIYPIQFDADPLHQIDRMVAMIEKGRILHASAAELLSAIHAALQSDTELANLLPQLHPETVIRAYLKALAHRLQSANS